MRHCDKCNIVYEGSIDGECPLCAARATLEKIRIVVKASPRMLEALKKIEHMLSSPLERYSLLEVIAIAQAAIAAAEGKEGE